MESFYLDPPNKAEIFRSFYFLLKWLKKKTVKQQNTKTLSDPQNEATETHRNLRVMTVEFNDSNQLCSFRLEIPVGEMRSQVVKDVMRWEGMYLYIYIHLKVSELMM